MDMLITLIIIVISQCLHISKHHVVHCKYISFLFVNHTSVKLGRRLNRSENEKNLHGQWSFSIYTKENADKAEASPKSKCCSVAFKSLNVAPFGRRKIITLCIFLAPGNPALNYLNLILKHS